MLTLTLVRHAKSSHDDTSIKDFDRPINDRGKSQTKVMAGVLQSGGIEPDLILCSTSRRTRQTLSRLLDVWPCKAEVVFDARLYLATSERLLSLIGKVGKNRKHILIVGHNPGLHLLAFNLAECGDPALLKALAEKFPTLALCSLRFDGDQWKQLGNGELVTFSTPQLAAAETSQPL